MRWNGSREDRGAPAAETGRGLRCTAAATAVVAPPARDDSHAFCAAVAAAATGGADLVADLRDVTALDVAALNALTAAARRLVVADRRLVLVTDRSELVRLLDECGVGRLALVCRTVADGLACCGRLPLRRSRRQPSR